MAKYKHVVLNTSRWESATICEWVDYYALLGFEHIYIYCNDDDPTEMYSTLIKYIDCRDPFVTFHHMPYQGQQPSCWMHFLDTHKHECEWFMYVDADEYLAIKPDNNIRRFMADREDEFDCIHFNWIWFGPESYKTRPIGSTLQMYTHRENEKVQMNYFTKTITRSNLVDARLIGRPPVDMLNHRWPATISARLREANVLGENMQEFFSDFPRSAENFMADLARRSKIVETACIYHYLFRSTDDFERRVKRGTLGAYYFQPMWGELPGKTEEFASFIDSLSACEDRYLADLWARREDEIGARAWATSLVKPNERSNLARTSRPTQSSFSPWSKGACVEEDALGAVSGIHTGADGFHTDCDDKPWWMTDLGADTQIDEIRVFNSLKSPAFASRAYPLLIETSCDGANWFRLFENIAQSPYGGADGHPLIVRCDRLARFVKLSLMTRDFFHLDEIEIYGIAK